MTEKISSTIPPNWQEMPPEKRLDTLQKLMELMFGPDDLSMMEAPYRFLNQPNTYDIILRFLSGPLGVPKNLIAHRIGVSKGRITQYEDDGFTLSPVRRYGLLLTLDTTINCWSLIVPLAAHGLDDNGLTSAQKVVARMLSILCDQGRELMKIAIEEADDELKKLVGDKFSRYLIDAEMTE